MRTCPQGSCPHPTNNIKGQPVDLNHRCHFSLHRTPVSLIPLLVVALLSYTLTGCSDDGGEMRGGAPQVTVIKIEPKDTPVSAEFVGKTASSRRVEIRSRVEGFLDKRVYTEGAMVEAGDVLFIMDTKPFEATPAGLEGRAGTAGGTQGHGPDQPQPDAPAGKEEGRRPEGAR